MEPLRALATFTANLTWEQVPAAVQDHTRLVLLDSLAAMVAGGSEPEVRRLAALAVAQSTLPQALLWSGGRRVAADWAALVNGTAGTALEVDEGHQFSGGHPALQVVPAALAEAEARRLSGAQLLLAVLVGYEVAARAGCGARLRPAVHPHGTWGTLGAAAAVARLRGLDPPETESAIALAAGMLTAASFRTVLTGATVRNLYAGLSGRNGILAVDLAAAGFLPEPGALQSAFAAVLGEAFDPAALTQGLGTRYEIRRNYFKLYSCCRWNHATLDALAALVRRTPIAWEQVTGVEVDTYRLATQIDGVSPANSFAARFSIPFAVATYLVNGSADPVAFDAAALSDPRVRRLAACVRVREEPDFTAQGPARRPARVRVCLRSGLVQEETVVNTLGGPENPVAADVVVEKFYRLTVPTLGKAAADALYGAVQRLDSEPDVRQLTAPAFPQVGEPA